MTAPIVFELARHGSWSVWMKRVDIRAFDRVVFFWEVRHDLAGQLYSGHGPDLDAATENAVAKFDHMVTGGKDR